MTTESFITFYLDDQPYGVDITYIREINKNTLLTPVPHSPNYIRGLMNVRGQIVTIFDLKFRLGMGRSQFHPLNHTIILKTDSELTLAQQAHNHEESYSMGDKVGLLVDNIIQVIAVPQKSIEVSPAKFNENIHEKYIAGLTQWEGKLVTLLNLGEILQYEP